MTHTETLLPSGIRVVTEHVPGQRAASIGAWIGCGSRHEPDDLAGATHFLEHLVFKGTPTRTALRIAQDFDAVGGDLNAFTTREMTCFHARVAPADTGLAIDTIADMIQHATLTPADVEAERGVVLEEIASHEDVPDEVVYDVFYRALWPDHPLGRPVEGVADTVGAMTPDQIARFLTEYYTPDRTVVSAAGDVNHDEIVELAAAAFADLAPFPSPPVGPPAAIVPRLAVEERPIEQAHLVYGTRGITRTDERRWALWVLNTALGGGMSSRLFQRIREERGLAYTVASGHQGFADTGIFNIYAGCSSEHLMEVLTIARTTLDEVIADGITDEEFDRARGHVRGTLMLSFDDANAVMSHLGRSALVMDRIDTVEQMLAAVDAVTPADVGAVARDVLGGSWTLAVLGARMTASLERFVGEAA